MEHSVSSECPLLLVADHVTSHLAAIVNVRVAAVTTMLACLGDSSQSNLVRGGGTTLGV